jgi:signal transduction histidine kinase
MLFVEQPGNVLLVLPSETIYGAVDTTQRALLIVLCLATCVVVFGRWRASSSPRRRALLPSVAGAACMLMFVWLLATDLVEGPRSQLMIMVAYCSMLVVPAAFLAGLLRSRLARGGLAQLFRDLSAMRGDALQAALGRALGDPTLVLAYQLPGSRGHVDAGGRPVLVPPVTSDRSSAPIARAGHEIAAIVYDASLDDDPEMVEAVRAAAAMALENERLLAESEVRLAEVQASRQRIVAAGDAERRRLERDLHDGAQQRLVALSLQLRMIRSDIRRDPAQAEQLAASASDELAHSLQELRELARGIHPATLDHGLAPALESLARRSTVATAVSCDAPEHVPRAVELAVYFVACEALANVGKYAEATAASVRLSRTAAGVAIEIADDGVGGADARHGSGLHGLADRVEALDGRLRVTSPQGSGTVITAELPCAS